MRRRASVLLSLAFLLSSGGEAPAAYLTVAERLQPHFDRIWHDELGAYIPGPGATMTQVNADLLLVHSVAALRGDTGPTRADERARRIARFLTGPHVWSGTPLPDALHDMLGPGWRAAPANPNMHPVFAAEAAEGLTYAYLAREPLGLDTATVGAIRMQVSQVATGPDFAWPALRLNQHNWPCAILAADATVNGRTDSLVDGMRRHLDRFLGAAHENFAGGLRFRYLPQKSPKAALNFDSSEYANVVMSFARHYGQARRAGMPAPQRLGLLRDWVRRVLAGSWTHAGYLNWDTGLGFGRWHQRKKVALAQQALLGIALEPELQPSPEWGAWARWMFDRGLEHYLRLVDELGDVPHGSAYGVSVVPQSRGTSYLTAARYAANAMRALHAGLDSRPSITPPALYAFDPDTGRLAITTPSYNTAIVAINQHAFPYGGLDLARLYDARQEVAANIGGVAPAAFGLSVRRARTMLQTQYGRRRGTSPLRLIGTAVHFRPSLRRAYAGPFDTLRVSGKTAAHGVSATSAYRFRSGAIDGRWTVGGRHAAKAHSGVRFPSWGRAAQLVAEFEDGRTIPVGVRPLALARIARLRIVSERSGYTVTPLARPHGARVRRLPTTAQDSAPDPGPTLEVTFPGRTSFAARLVVTPGQGVEK
jgi:hypothetical protein